jgi:peptidoglycan/xylan/chitin deacetylase (PgdA/CDA1 family)
MRSRTEPSLTVVMYHYVRDVAGSEFPHLKAMPTAEFADQVDRLGEHYELASLDSALAFLHGESEPRRNLCLLTFDDGLRCHAENVLPILERRSVQGVFNVPTACIEHHKVLPIHQSHALMAHVGPDRFEAAFLSALGPADRMLLDSVTQEEATTLYRWDAIDVARFKYFMNYRLGQTARNAALQVVFADVFGPEEEFARSFYLSWDDVRAMQRAGMAVGGHTHSHPNLSTCSSSVQEFEISECMRVLTERARPQSSWPFAYPYGRASTFDERSVRMVRAAGFACAFTTELGVGVGGDDVFRLRRIDPKDLDAGGSLRAP